MFDLWIICERVRVMVVRMRSLIETEFALAF
jgi:hypothetical protein